MIRTGLNCPWTSSTGRLFDAVAALLRICKTNEHEAQAAMALEAAAAEFKWGAARVERISRCAVAWSEEAGLWELDVRPVVESMLAARSATSGELAWAFHWRLAEGWVALADAVRENREKFLSVSGGVFCNALFSRHLQQHAEGQGFEILLPNIYPPTDAGLAFGQAIFSRHVLLTGAGRIDKRTNKSFI